MAKQLMSSDEHITAELNRQHLLRLQPNRWLKSAVMDAVIRLLNVRQRGVEAADPTAPRTLYIDTLFTANLHPCHTTTEMRCSYDERKLMSMCSPSNLCKATGCQGCCLAQDSIVFPVNLSQVHWVAVKLDMAACRITCYDSLEEIRVSGS